MNNYKRNLGFPLAPTHKDKITTNEPTSSLAQKLFTPIALQVYNKVK
jgi:hypothetical protein